MYNEPVEDDHLMKFRNDFGAEILAVACALTQTVVDSSNYLNGTIPMIKMVFRMSRYCLSLFDWDKKSPVVLIKSGKKLSLYLDQLEEIKCLIQSVCASLYTKEESGRFENSKFAKSITVDGLEAEDIHQVCCYH